MLRMELLTQGPGEDPVLLRSIDLSASVEMAAPPAPPPAPVDPKAKGETPVPDPPPEPRKMLIAFAPSIAAEEVPDAATLLIGNFQASLNGQSFFPCTEIAHMKLEPVRPESPSADAWVCMPDRVA